MTLLTGPIFKNSHVLAGIYVSLFPDTIMNKISDRNSSFQVKTKGLYIQHISNAETEQTSGIVSEFLF